MTFYGFAVMELAAEIAALERDLEILLQVFTPDNDCPFTMDELEEQLLQLFSNPDPLDFGITKESSPNQGPCAQTNQEPTPRSRELARCPVVFPLLLLLLLHFGAPTQSKIFDPGGPPSHACLQGLSLRLGGKHVCAQPKYYGQLQQQLLRVESAAARNAAAQPGRAPFPIATEMKPEVTGNDISLQPTKTPQNHALEYEVDAEADCAAAAQTRSSSCSNFSLLFSSLLFSSLSFSFLLSSLLFSSLFFSSPLLSSLLFSSFLFPSFLFSSHLFSSLLLFSHLFFSSLFFFSLLFSSCCSCSSSGNSSSGVVVVVVVVVV